MSSTTLNTGTQATLDFDPYIPPELQQALIEGVRREIYRDRYSQKDPRYITAAEKFDEICLQGQNFHDHARRNFAVYVR
jgi:hypothetical protein